MTGSWQQLIADMLKNNLYVLLALVVLFFYSGFATFKWLTVKKNEIVKCDTKKLTAERDQLQATLSQANVDLFVARQEGAQAMNDNQQAFTPLKEIVREIKVPVACDVAFPTGVQNALDKAVQAANNVHPTEHK